LGIRKKYFVPLLASFKLRVTIISADFIKSRDKDFEAILH
jgi:hypothetical protein